jgi:hypothetical protein
MGRRLELASNMSANLIIEIADPLVDPEDKYDKAVESLQKALGIKKFEYESYVHTENSPYKSVKQLSDEMFDDVQNRLYRFYEELRDQWIKRQMHKAKDGRILKLNNKIYLNPKTGKPMTMSEWKIIKKDIQQLTDWIFGDYDEALVKRAVALGRILQKFETIDERVVADIADLDIDAVINSISRDDIYRNIIDYGIVHTGELIVDLSNKIRKQIVSVIMDSYYNKTSNKELTSQLFDTFAELNRDWRRIVETETAYNFNVGYILAELEAKPDNEKYVFVEGISSANACNFCKDNIDGHTFVLLPDAPKSGDEVEIEGDIYIAIWPGKRNLGPRATWRPAVISHPNCFCSFIKIDYRSDDFSKKLREIASQT